MNRSVSFYEQMILTDNAVVIINTIEICQGLSNLLHTKATYDKKPNLKSATMKFALIDSCAALRLATSDKHQV